MGCRTKYSLTTEVAETVRARFEAKVSRSSDPNGCWEWTGRRVKNSGFDYGRIYICGMSFATHHVALALDGRPVPVGMLARHKCDNPPCVNPAHLEVGTNSDNMRDREARGRNPRTRLTEEQVREACNLRAQGWTYSALSKRYRAHRNTLESAIHGRSWKRLSGLNRAGCTICNRRGARNPNAKLTDDAVREMRTMRAAGATYADLGARFGVTTTNARKACVGTNWKHVEA